jgi:hypothetical protein
VENINAEPPQLRFRYLVDSWLNRPGESKRSDRRIIALKELRQAESEDLQLDQWKGARDVLSAILGEDKGDQNTRYLFLRFKDEEALGKHGEGELSKEIVGFFVKTEVISQFDI